MFDGACKKVLISAGRKTACESAAAVLGAWMIGVGHVVSLNGDAADTGRTNVARPPSCRVLADTPVALHTAAGEVVHSEGQAIAQGGGVVLVAGSPVLVRKTRGYEAGVIGGRPAGGTLIDLSTKATLFPTPPGDTMLYSPLVSFDGKGSWDFVWSRQEQGDKPSVPVLALYHAAFDGARWTRAVRVAGLPRAVWGPSAASGLMRTSQGLAFAVPIPSSMSGGEVALLLRSKETWHEQRVSTGTGAGSAYAALHVAGRSLLLAYVTGDGSSGGGANALYVRRSTDLGASWSPPARIVGSNAYEPQLISVGRTAIGLIWRQRVEDEGSLRSPVFLSISRDGGKWGRPAPLDDGRSVEHMAIAPLSDHSAVALLQLGGLLRREHLLLRLHDASVEELLRTSVDAVTRVLLVSTGNGSFRAVWSRGEAIPGGLLPHTLVWDFTVRCHERS